MLMANYSKNKKAESSRELLCNCNERKLDFGKVRRCKRGSKKTREVRKRDKREI